MLQKQGFGINFGKGLQLKEDPWQIQAGNFLALKNSVFTIGDRLTKRNGYGTFTSLPSGYSASFLTTLNDNLTAIGSSILAYSGGNDEWLDKGYLQPVELNTMSLIRSGTNQSQVDTAISPENSICTIYTDQTPTSTGTPRYMYVVADVVTGQNLIVPTQLSSADATYGTSRVFTLGNYFVILWTKYASSDYSLWYTAINYTDLSLAPVSAQIVSSYSQAVTQAFDGVVLNNTLYIAYTGASFGGIRAVSLNQFLQLSSTFIVDANNQGTLFSVTADVANQAVWISYSAGSTVYTLAIPPNFSYVQYTFTVTSAHATVGAVYSNNSNHFTVSATISGATTLVTVGTAPPLASGTLTKVSGTGDSTIAFSSVSTLTLNYLLSPTEVQSTGSPLSIASTAYNNILLLYVEQSNSYTYDSTIPTNYVTTTTCTIGGTVGTPGTLARSIGLASKAFLLNTGISYVLTEYQSLYQPTYFLMDQNGNIISRLAYGNGGINAGPGTNGPIVATAYLPNGLPSVNVDGNIASVAYLYKDFVTSQNTSTTQSITKSGIYSQTGINLVNFTIGTSNVVPVETASALHLTGGFEWEYDGYVAVEHNFFVWPDSVKGTPYNTGGSINSGHLYQYQAVYTYSDNQGNIHRSAPSIPINIDLRTTNTAFTQPTPKTPTASGTAGTYVLTVSSAVGLAVGQIVTDTTNPTYIQANSYITNINSYYVTLNLPLAGSPSTDTLSISSICSVELFIPTLRLTYKTENPVTIQLFRWSDLQQEFFQVTSITNPLINDPTVDYVEFVDTLADSSIIGNSLIYTTGGVIEDVAAPSFKDQTLFDDRVFGIDSEDDNLLWFSKQVIETTPVEFSDLLTIYVAPSTAAEGSTGPMQCIFPMDDKLIIFKANAMYFINGTGPDNTGANSQYSQPIFITSTVGSVNKKSIVMTDTGLMFQSNKGIWRLQRNGLTVDYLGAPVEGLTLSGNANSAWTIPETTQARFTMDSGITIMYDYYYGQFGTFTGVPAISSCLYNNLHTYLDKYGNIFQEIPGIYLDGDIPVVMSFTTGWFNLAGLQGYERFYDFYLLGQYISPHILIVNVAYDYSPFSTQQSVIYPNNYTGPYGSDQLFGQTTPYGGPGNLEQWRIHTKRQTCQSFQITVTEQFNPAFLTAAGAGLYLSGLTGQLGIKKSARPIRAINSVG